MVLDIKQYAFFQALTYLPYVDEILLYGSRARGTHLERSDIDLAILCPRASKQEWGIILAIIEGADTLLKIDCVRLDSLKDGSIFKENILKDHKVLYRKGTPV